MATRTLQFKVVGSGAFPVDMLRYDGVYPAHESPDSASITNSLTRYGSDAPLLNENELREFGFDGKKTVRAWVVTLEKVTDQKNWVPTGARWASFSWHLVAGSLIRVR